ncbi:Mu P family protein [Burkholderia pyrrocinia]|nr:Mu P family protein [Burkholderia pyrrocinia]
MSPTSNVVHYDLDAGVSVSGWSSVRVTAGIDRIPRSFELEMTERFPGAEDVLISPGDYCEIRMGDSIVLTGYIDVVNPSINANTHGIRVIGRGKCADIVDCSAQWPNSQIANCSAFDIAKTLADVYGIPVQLAPAVDQLPRIPQMNIMLGETAYQIIERVCRFSGLLVYELADGTLYLSRASSLSMDSGIQEGINLESASVENSVANRFSEIQAVMMAVNNLEDLNAVNAPVFTATDPNVTRHRRRIIIAEAGQLGWDVSTQRALWEVARRYGLSNVLHVTVDNWRDISGNLWEPNRLISVLIPSMKVSGDESGIVPRQYLIVEVTFHRGLEGTHAELTLMPPEAFLPEPILLQPANGDVISANVGGGQ